MASTTQKILYGAVGVTTAVAAFLIIQSRAAPGFWSIGRGCLPCSTQSPNTASECPDTPGELFYLRYDAVMMQAAPWIWEGITKMLNEAEAIDKSSFVKEVPENVDTKGVPLDEAIYGGQGGAAHTIQYLIMLTIDGKNYGWFVPLGSQKAGGGWIMAPPPYRNMPVRNLGTTLCDEYRTMGGTATCPSNASLASYANQLKSFGEWQAAWPTVNAQRIAMCSAPQPTPPPASTKTPIPQRTPTPSASSRADDWIYAFNAQGYSAGCGPDTYCPNQPVTREQIAVFGLKFVHGPGYVPPKCVPPGHFNDVPCVAGAAQLRFDP